jgi:hypothetical protein
MEDQAMIRKVIEKFEIGEISVEVGPAISKDAGLVPVVRHIRESEWFNALVDRLLAAIASSPRRCSGFRNWSKLEAGLLALIAGLVMGRRNPNAIAQSFALDPLWRATIGRKFNQRDLSRLVELLGDLGEGPLRRALLSSAQAGQDHLELDMDSSVLELYGTQEGGGYNTHYQTFGYHAGWAIDTRNGKLAALWLNEGNAFTATGQADQLTWILDQGARVNLARFDAGLIGPEMLQAIEGRVPRFVCRIKSNEVLERLASPIEPPGPLYAGAKSYGEFRYGAETWEREQRVVVRFQAPDGPDGEMVLFADPERFYFVTSLEESPAEVVATYLRRGESERVFGEFKSTLEPTFRHQEVRKNGIWALLVALAYNVLCDLRDLIPKPEKLAKVKVEHRPDFLPEPWVFGFHRLLDGVPVRPLLARFRDVALRVPCELRIVGERLHLYVQPDILAPVWFPALVRD